MCDKKPPGSGNRSPYRDESVVGQLAKIAGELEFSFDQGLPVYYAAVERLTPQSQQLHQRVLASPILYWTVGQFCLWPLCLEVWLATGELHTHLLDGKQPAKYRHAPNEWEVYG